MSRHRAGQRQKRHDRIQPMITLNVADGAIHTDIDATVPYRQNKYVLFGQQEDCCNGCHCELPFCTLEVDHIIRRYHGSADHVENLQLLCARCNRVKGDRP